VTLFGAVVRADSIRQLTEAGWGALVDYGVRTIVDLRLDAEREADPPHPAPLEIVHVPLGDYAANSPWALDDDAATSVRRAYVELLERYRRGFARAVSAVGSAAEGGVLVHCFAGKDRTGLVSAMLLRLAGVGLDDIVADYALSAENIRPNIDPWAEGAPDDAERRLRLRIGSSPPEAMLDVLSELERRHGSIGGYLREAGAADADLEHARWRLIGRTQPPRGPALRTKAPNEPR
jgi:protein-tyrosine phosphatase